MRRRGLCGVLVLTLALQACGTLTARVRDATGREADRYASTRDLKAEVDSLAQPLIERGETVGLSVGVLLPDGRQEFFGYGETRKGNGARPDGRTLYALGSLSKGFLGATVASLVSEGAIHWEDRLGDLLPTEQRLGPDARNITIRQLATHTSGLPRYPVVWRPSALYDLFGFFVDGRDIYAHLTDQYGFHKLQDFRAPETRAYTYSNLGYGVLGRTLERHTRESLDALLARHVLQPLGLRNTGYDAEELPAYAQKAGGHAGDQPKLMRRGSPIPDSRMTRLMRGAGGLHSNAEDLIRFAAAHLPTGPQPLATVLAGTLEPELVLPDASPAVAWEVETVDGRRIAYQVGLIAGYSCYVGLDAERGIAVAVLQNTMNWTDHVGQRLLLRLAKAYPEPLRSAAPLHQ